MSMSKESSLENGTTNVSDHDITNDNEKDNDHPTQSSSKHNEYEVTLDSSEDPKHRPLWQRWLMVAIICTSAFCVTFDSSAAGFTESGLIQSFHISKEVSVLSISLFVEGLGLGPLLLGPLSEFFGRWKVYAISYGILWGLSWAVAFAPNAGVHLAFRFLAGVSGSAFLSVAGGSVSDLFANHEIAYPMAVYTASPFMGPSLGPVISGFINQNISWRWTYYIVLIWQFIQLMLLTFFVPETYEPVLRQRKAAKLRKETGDESYYAPLDLREGGVARAVVVSCYKPFQILFYEPMAFLLDLWSSLLLGILYLSFQAFPVIFEQNHGFNEQLTGLAFLGIGLGMLIVPCTHPWWNRIYIAQAKKHGPNPPPEVRLIPGFAGAILAPLSLLILTFTSSSNVHWSAPIIASIPFGSGIIFSFTGVFTYLVVAYRTYAASAMAGNSFLRSAFAAGFPLFSGPMFANLGSEKALGILTALMVAIAPLPFVFYRYGAYLRRNSRFASS